MAEAIRQKLPPSPSPDTTQNTTPGLIPVLTNATTSSLFKWDMKNYITITINAHPSVETPDPGYLTVRIVPDEGKSFVGFLLTVPQEGSLAGVYLLTPDGKVLSVANIPYTIPPIVSPSPSMSPMIPFVEAVAVISIPSKGPVRVTLYGYLEEVEAEGKGTMELKFVKPPELSGSSEQGGVKQ